MTKSHAMLLSAMAGLSLFVSSCALPHSRVADLLLLGANAGTEVRFQKTSELQIADIHCPRGIGRAEFALPAGTEPDKIVFRLHLKGLEGCSVMHDGSKVQASVSSHGDLAIREWREDGKPVAEKDRIPISIISSSGSPPRIPLDGWIEIRLPQSCKGNCSVGLEWVDFYR
jgi:hypothetical protein